MVHTQYTNYKKLIIRYYYILSLVIINQKNHSVSMMCLTEVLCIKFSVLQRFDEVHGQIISVKI